MATGAFSSCTISSNGCQATVVFDAPTPNSWAGAYTYDVSKCTFAVVSEGYSSGVLGTVNRSVGVASVASESVNGSSQLEVIVNLDDQVYDDDANGGAGTSGTDPTITLTDGFVTDGSSDTSGATTASSCTNSSTLDYPNVIGRWSMVPFQKFDTATVNADAIAFHRHGIDMVSFVLTDSAAATDSGSTSTLERIANPYDYGAGDWYLSYRCTFDTTSLDDGAGHLTCSIYPLVGDADSVRTMATDTTMDSAAARLPVYLNHGGSLPTYYAYVDTGSGNDTTGVASTTAATAAATPCATVFGALKKIAAAYGTYADGGVIRLANAGNYDYGTYSFPTQDTLDTWVTIEPAPGLTASDVAFTSRGNTSGLRTKLVRVRNATVVQTSALGSTYSVLVTDNSLVDYLWCDGCVFDGTATDDVVSTGWFGAQWTGIYTTGCYCHDSYEGARGDVLSMCCEQNGLGSDHWSGSKCVLNCKSNAAEAQAGAHADVYQVASAGLSQIVVCGLHVTNQVDCNIAVFFNGNGTGSLSDSAFVNMVQDTDETANLSQFDSCTLSNVLFLSCTTRDGIDTNNTSSTTSMSGVLWRDCVMQSLAFTNGPSYVAPAWFRNNHDFTNAARGSTDTTGSTWDDEYPNFDSSSAVNPYPAPSAPTISSRVSVPFVPYDVFGQAVPSGGYVGGVQSNQRTTGGKVLL